MVNYVNWPLTSLVILDNLSVNASRNKSHDLSAPLYHARKLAQSDKGSRSYYNIKDELLKQSSGQSSTESVSAPKSASRSKILVEERDNDEAGETWQKLSGHSIIAGERLQEKFDEAVTC